ncbi:hypothetical protein A2765_03445 [Candidatus Kaiserbacteria bacterium RIFCSPHIGHO2_01_FULL_56_24]|uniref:Uncharacterized protein n=1 Tax=Candidatus Kaiserbacteria bacterium RIFCSPHIGHO2_01_FULL_56_24 TaxID=1798487 RepID=A0A1F6DGV8_9BACT|nr:MAG: hypothetical protein A2765_03445 [Candidatus Kaiserbacteria bacterium RIFCSPHIGHO2_01_FULL_56_24]
MHDHGDTSGDHGDHAGHESGDHGDKGGGSINVDQHQHQSQQTSVKAGGGFGGLAIVVVGGMASSRASGCSTCYAETRRKKRATLPDIKNGNSGADRPPHGCPPGEEPNKYSVCEPMD